MRNALKWIFPDKRGLVIKMAVSGEETRQEQHTEGWQKRRDDKLAAAMFR